MSFRPRDLMTHPRRGATDKIFLPLPKHGIIYSTLQCGADDFSISMFLLGFLKHIENSALNNGFLSLSREPMDTIYNLCYLQRALRNTSVNGRIKMATGMAVIKMAATRVMQCRCDSVFLKAGKCGWCSASKGTFVGRKYPPPWCSETSFMLLFWRRHS